MNKIRKSLLFAATLTAGCPWQLRAAEEDPCRTAWERNEAEVPAEERLGNSYAMNPKSDSWHFTAEIDGQEFLIVPQEIVAYELETGEECRVPVAWKALSTSLAVAIDPKFENARKVTLVAGKPVGYQSKGGIYERYSLSSFDSTDVNLLWFLNAAPIPDDAPNLLRQKLSIPAEQALQLFTSADLLAHKPKAAIDAVAMTLGKEEPIKQWAVTLADAAKLWPQLRFLPMGTPASGATVEEAWKASKILDLAVMKLWDAEQNRLVPCSVASSSPTSCRQIVDATFSKQIADAQAQNKELCVHLAWKGEDFAVSLVSTFCVDPTSGKLRFDRTRYAQNPTVFGLPKQAL